MRTRLFLLCSVFMCCILSVFSQEKGQKYDVAAFLYPAYASDDPRFYDHFGLRESVNGKR